MFLGCLEPLFKGLIARKVRQMPIGGPANADSWAENWSGVCRCLMAQANMLNAAVTRDRSIRRRADRVHWPPDGNADKSCSHVVHLKRDSEVPIYSDFVERSESAKPVSAEAMACIAPRDLLHFSPMKRFLPAHHCPGCHEELHPSKFSSAFEFLLPLLLMRPFRCWGCGRRFWRVIFCSNSSKQTTH